MILLKFLKQQNWWYAIPCIALWYFIHWIVGGLNWTFALTSIFIILYSLKFADKNKGDATIVDTIRLILFFVYFTAYLLYNDDDLWYMLCMIVPSFILFSYFYSILLFYKKDMEEKGHITKNYTWILILLTQSVIMLGIIVWAITQKVEADKQKDLAVMAQKEAEKQKMLAEQAKDAALKSQRNAIMAKDEAMKYKVQYEEALKQKK